MDHKIENALPY